VTGIADRAFSECANLKSVVIPSGVKSIGNYAFNKCSSLTSVSIPNTVTSIGTNAFSYCESLTRITLPDSITNISAFLFQYCEKLNNVTIPNTVTRIGASAFLSCKSLATVTIPESVTSIGSAAFSRCENLKSITIPNSITNIEAYAFENSLILPDSVVYFNGTIKEWNALYTACNTYGNNDSLFNCIAYCSDGIADCKHEFDDGAITTAATCTERGVKTYTCTACGVIKNESIPANGHTTVTIEGVDPTCTESGKTSGLYCSVCNKVILPQTTLPAAHSYDEGVVTKAATCTETGIKTYSCIKCAETKTETIPRKGHTAVADEAVAPTCTKTGLTKGYHCSDCNTVIVAQKVVDVTEHSYDNGKVTKASTCTKNGTKTYTCTVCKATKTETISAKGHSYDSGKVTKAATCSATGVKTYTCTVCKATKTETIKVTAHKAVTDKAVAATCTKAGKTAGSHCSVCNATITAQEIVPAKGHNYKTTTTKATTKKNGSIVKKCSACGVSTKTTIYYPKTITLSKTSYVYNGKAQKPSVTVKDSKGKKIAESNYTVKYTSNKNVGKATVTITFKGNYKGTVKKTFTINPKATTLSSVTAKSKGFTAKWKK
ncbi:MAG: leucine-rich repeat domain-containing protein, partial [Eubacterium sp.]|nr:leucine-rich repeat domain-containing protein [Eubacterium sp.]